MKKASKTKFWLLYHGGLLVFSLIVAMIMKYNQTGKALIPETLVPFGTIFVLSALIGYLAVYMVNRSAKMSHPQVMNRIVPGLLIFFISSFIIANVVVSLGVFVWFLALGKDLHGFSPWLFYHELNYASRQMLIWFLFFSIVFFYILWRKSYKKEQSLQEEMLKFQYQTLKSQINPHFLFNSLNTLSELVYEDAGKADNYIQALSNMYRYIIENEENRLISLAKEISFVQHYFNLQQARDEDKIALKINIPSMEKYQILPVSIQLLVENAIKHNSYSRNSPLSINISYDNDYIVVSNTLQRKNIMEQTTRKGLKNLQERVRLILGNDLIIIEENNLFVVKIPIIHSQP
ncbi:MAG TPA: histidine kinase [Bacteroidales bacterium]|nr:histidine kinase [Bacteroidales bacterium]